LHLQVGAHAGRTNTKAARLRRVMRPLLSWCPPLFAGAKHVANALTESRAAPTFDFTDDRREDDGIFLRVVLSR